jgi:organic hydroperoxide reductase OsmC/OhrA
MAKHHTYQTTTIWTGNTGQGTADYRAYLRNYEVNAAHKSAPILGSSDPAFRGDRTRYNPEELLVASLSSCHMLWMLHLCAEAGIVVTAYMDQATGIMAETEDGAGHFTEVTLRPHITITDAGKIAEAEALNARAHHLCFIARSVNFPVRHEALITASPVTATSTASTTAG